MGGKNKIERVPKIICRKYFPNKQSRKLERQLNWQNETFRRFPKKKSVRKKHHIIHARKLQNQRVTVNATKSICNLGVLFLRIRVKFIVPYKRTNKLTTDPKSPKRIMDFIHFPSTRGISSVARWSSCELGCETCQIRKLKVYYRKNRRSIFQRTINVLLWQSFFKMPHY